MKKLIIANWKMNPTTPAEARKIFNTIKAGTARQRKAEVIVIPPFVFLPLLKERYRSSKIKFGVQDVFWERKGPYTGEISTKQAKEVGASYVIVGHSERRALGETNQEVAKKVSAVLREGMRPILCVGEALRDRDGKYLEELYRQIKDSLSGVSSSRVSGVVIAYEPIWAIGKGAKDAVDSHELQATIILIRKSLSRVYSKSIAMKMQVIYGGSVERGNVDELWKSGVDGFLVGHASLSPKEFVEIIQSVR